MTVRTVLAPIVGLVVGGLTVALVETLGHLLFPPPEGVDLTDPAALAALMAEVPPEALVVVLAAWFLGTFVGVWAALRTHPTHARWPGYVTAAALAAAAAYTIVAIPHPVWFVVLAVVVYALATWIGLRTAPPPSVEA